MSDTRRNFMSAAALAAGLAKQAAGAARTQGAGGGQPQAAGSVPRPAADVQVPKMKFGGVEISRLICGQNQFYGFSHFNRILSTLMQDYFTPDRVCGHLFQCLRFGINAVCFHPGDRGGPDMRRFRAEGGQMHLIAQGAPDPAAMIQEFKPLAVYHHGENTDVAYQNAEMNTVKEWCKRVRDMGALVGVGTHQPEVIALIEEQGWDVDFYAGCVYNRTRTQQEWRQVLNGELVELQGDCYLQSDPPRMYRTMRQTSKPCFAFKILAAGRVANAEQAFRTAFQSLKPIDGVFVGMFPLLKDEVRENAEIVHRILAGS